MDLADCSTIIVFGGTFDPPQVAHVELPRRAMESVAADAVVYMPTVLSPLKLEAPPSPAHHRLAMLRLALRDEPWATVLTDEIDRAGSAQPAYTVDTLSSLRQHLGDSVVMRLLIGADQLRVFDRWKQPRRIIALAEPLVMLRPPETHRSLLSALPKGFDPNEWKHRIIELPILAVSSTAIRQSVSRGESISGLVAPDVETYIRAKGMYQ